MRMSLFISNTRNSQLTTRGLTLVEMLISMAVTLLMMAAVVNLFANIGAGVRNRRASMELGSQLRLARARLFKDLAGATCAVRPKLPSDDHDDGYLEIIEGEFSDKNPTNIALTDVTIVPSTQISNIDGGGLGDFDDILALTVRSESEPFVGPGRVFNNTTNVWEDGTIKSNVAEIIWFTVENPTGDPVLEPGMRTTYRRVLLIAPWIDLSSVTPNGATNAERFKNFYDQYDISVRLEQPATGNLMFVPNTLSDLTKRENRFAHFVLPPAANVFPWAINDRRIRFDVTTPHPLSPLEGDREGEDVMLNDVLAFDLRVYDPGAPLFENAGHVVEPSDLGWNTAPPASLVGVGAYTDLYWNHTSPTWQTIATKNWTHPVDAPSPLFADAPDTKSGLNRSTAAVASVAYDTSPYHYEDDGIDQDNDGLVDEGTDGLDNNNANGVDDVGERETTPPYDTPLRGMQVKIRVYERDTRQIREATVTRNFVPQ